MSPYPEVFSMKGQVALITGGGTGIGQAIARCMFQAGAKLALVGRRKEELARAASELGEGVRYFVHDITAMDQAEALARKIEQSMGGVTCLVNNAGMHLKKAALDTSVAEFMAVLNTNVTGTHALIKAFAPGMIERQSGSILFISSMASLFGIPQVSAYSAAKSAHLGLVRSLATELSPHCVRVNAIAPGWIDTDMSRKALANDAERRERVLGRTPMRRLGQPSDVGWAAVYLASPASAFVTGTILAVDGGVSIGF
jgi:gluconate 5-dehydrogenase